MDFLNFMKKDDSEREIVQFIKDNCKPYLKETKGKLFLWRGYKKNIKEYTTLKSKTRTKSKFSSQELFIAIDDTFESIFGWRPRSESIYVSNSYSMAKAYGLPYLFFPIGVYKYIWSPTIKDLYEYGVDKNYIIKDNRNKESSNIELINKSIEDGTFHRFAKKHYINSDIKMCADNCVRNEIMFGCRSYVLVNSSYKHVLMEELKDWNV